MALVVQTPPVAARLCETCRLWTLYVIYFFIVTTAEIGNNWRLRRDGVQVFYLSGSSNFPESGSLAVLTPEVTALYMPEE